MKVSLVKKSTLV